MKARTKPSWSKPQLVEKPIEETQAGFGGVRDGVIERQS